MEILSIRHKWPEKSGFMISRPVGRTDYTFLHFFNPIKIMLDGEYITTKPHACIFIAPGTAQWFRSEKDLVHDWAHLSSSVGETLKELNIEPDTIYYPTNYDFISVIFRKAESEFFAEMPFKNKILKAHLYEFLVRFARETQSVSPRIEIGYEERKLLSMIRQNVIANSDEKWTVEKMAKQTHLSVSRFHALYKAVFGISPINDVIEARIRNAKNLLLSDGSTVNEISEKLGYSTPYHFIRQFKKFVGETPNEYRKSRL